MLDRIAQIAEIRDRFRKMADDCFEQVEAVNDDIIRMAEKFKAYEIDDRVDTLFQLRFGVSLETIIDKPDQNPIAQSFLVEYVLDVIRQLAIGHDIKIQRKFEELDELQEDRRLILKRLNAATVTIPNASQKKLDAVQKQLERIAGDDSTQDKYKEMKALYDQTLLDAQAKMVTAFNTVEHIIQTAKDVGIMHLDIDKVLNAREAEINKLCIQLASKIKESGLSTTASLMKGGRIGDRLSVIIETPESTTVSTSDMSPSEPGSPLTSRSVNSDSAHKGDSESEGVGVVHRRR